MFICIRNGIYAQRTKALGGCKVSSYTRYAIVHLCCHHKKYANLSKSKSTCFFFIQEKEVPAVPTTLASISRQPQMPIGSIRSSDRVVLLSGFGQALPKLDNSLPQTVHAVNRKFKIIFDYCGQTYFSIISISSGCL